MKQKIFFVLLSFSYFAVMCSQNVIHKETSKSNSSMNSHLDTATFGAGCYWCVEAIFQRLDGVVSVESGFSGGYIINPSYREVCTGTTGHAEVCRIVFDPDTITYAELLEVFWKTHDPTTLNRQGNDTGTQYRSVIFYHNQAQKDLSVEMKERLTQEHIWENPILTEILPFESFFKADDYHQDYYNRNGSQPYCEYVITPKIEKFEKIFKEKIRH
jgi:peptide-methionine (S)-S-oxide reductase